MITMLYTLAPYLPAAGKAHDLVEAINLCDLKKFFSRFRDAVIFVRRRDTDFLIKANYACGDLDALSRCKKDITLKNTTFRLHRPYEMNVLRGVISHPELSYMVDSEIKMLLESQNVIYVNKSKKSSNVAIIGFPKNDDSTIPPTVVLGWDTVVVRPYVPNPTRCNNCQRYGHIAASCQVPHPVCSTCAKTGHSADTCPQDRIRCPACSGNHSATDPDCPKWKEEKAVAKIKHQNKLSYKDALLRLRTAVPPPPKKKPPTPPATEEDSIDSGSSSYEEEEESPDASVNMQEDTDAEQDIPAAAAPAATPEKEKHDSSEFSVVSSRKKRQKKR